MSPELGTFSRILFISSFSHLQPPCCISEGMTEFRIRELRGSDAGPLVSPLYQAEGNGITIRSDDLFFVGLIDEEIVGSVRFCVEEETPMLRTMRIAEKFQGKGFGRKLLKYFESYLIQNRVSTTYCIPYAHLENFYAAIGFRRVEESLAPTFLQERLKEYRKRPQEFICMLREARQ